MGPSRLTGCGAPAPPVWTMPRQSRWLPPMEMLSYLLALRLRLRLRAPQNWMLLHTSRPMSRRTLAWVAALEAPIAERASGEVTFQLPAPRSTAGEGLCLQRSASFDRLAAL